MVLLADSAAINHHQPSRGAVALRHVGACRSAIPVDLLYVPDAECSVPALEIGAHEAREAKRQERSSERHHDEPGTPARSLDDRGTVLVYLRKTFATHPYPL